MTERKKCSMGSGMILLTHGWSHREIKQGMFRSSITVYRKVK